MSSFILGINFLHSDSSACIFKDNELIAAAEEERFNRVKHTSVFPTESIKFCLNKANINISNLDCVTINSNPFSSIFRKINFLLKNISSFDIGFSSLLNSKKKINLKKYLNSVDINNKFNGRVKFIDHHASHIASSLFFSNFTKCANISIDGFGDFASCAWGLYEKEKLKIEKKIYFPHSLGIFYQTLTQFLGFKSYGDEYKLMGLSPYGKPKYCNELYELITKTKNGFKLNLDYFLHHKQKIFEINNSGQFIYKNLYSKKINKLFSFERLPEEKITQDHIDLAKSVQTVYEDIFFHLLNIIYKKYNVENLSISGGCAMNSVANGKIIKNTNFKNIYISPNPGDAGGSVGSASIYINKKYKKKFHVQNYAYLGNSYKNDEILKVLKENSIDDKFEVKFLDDNDLYSRVSKSLTEEKIVGWFQEKMEWGPRALGNRSILADARNPKIKDIINSKIKRRESFRPFAPSILEDQVTNWFEVDKKVPFMSEVYLIKSEKKKLIPGVTHVDGTGRLQTVSFNNNPRYYNLIKQFFNITKVPIILNTSFNENEPIVNKPIEAINCFERTSMDILVLGNWFIFRNN